MPLATSVCCCCFPKLLNQSLRERLVGHGSNAGGTCADAAAAPEQQQPAAAAAMQSSASLQRLLAHGISSSCPNLHLLEEQAQQQQQQQQQARQGSRSFHSKTAARPPGSPQMERSSSQEAPAAPKAKQIRAGPQVQIELKPAQANPFLGVEHLTAGRGFVKARPGA
uniref:Uncharacterized protein n=1 Tax=Tetradesmus obliquus TaxID=3088 RepID=A0A383VVN7_TETOB